MKVATLQLGRDFWDAQLCQFVTESHVRIGGTGVVERVFVRSVCRQFC